MSNPSDHPPGFYYAERLPFGSHPGIPETIVRITPDGRLIDTHNLLTDWFDYNILGPVPTRAELDAMNNATGDFNPCKEMTP